MEILRNKTVLVTGGTGTIGSEIVRQLLKTEAAQIRIYSRDEHKQYELKNELADDPRLRFLIGDVRDKDRLDFAFRGVNVCFHAAALKHVPICEYNPFEAMKTNILGTQNVVDVSIRNNLEKVVAVSTDKAVNPESVLGASKLMMERLVIAANLTAGSSKTRFACVRFGNVLNSRGSVLELWRKQMAAGKPITISDKRMVRFFMEVRQAVELIFSASRAMNGGEIFVLKMPTRSIMEFADEAVRQYGNGKEVERVFIGARPGEKLKEGLLTAEEFSRALETETMFIIPSEQLATRGFPVEAGTYAGAKTATSEVYVYKS